MTAEAPAAAALDVSCTWAEADAESAYWATACGKDFTLNDGTPDDNGLRFCCYCGKPLAQARYQPEDDDA